MARAAKPKAPPKTVLKPYSFTIQVHVLELDPAGDVVGTAHGDPKELFGKKLDGPVARQFDRMVAQGIAQAEDPEEE